MSSAEPPSTPPDPDEPRLSFKDREMLAALRRLANARSAVSALEEQLARQEKPRNWDPADVAKAESYEVDIDKLRHKAQGRFGGGSARGKLAEAEMQQRLVFERLGVASIDAMRSLQNPSSIAETVDPAYMSFARSELKGAEEAYQQVMDMPDDDPPEADDEADAPEVPDYPPSIDLTRPEAS